MKKLLILLIFSTSLLWANGNQEESIKITQSNNILIAYFTWADNTTVINEQASIESALAHYSAIGDNNTYPDLSSSASLLKPGNTAQLALHIQEFVGGDLHSITTEVQYPSSYDECLDIASDEKGSNARPRLSSHIENIECYDTIFLGFPNWWYTVPMPILSFIEQYDFSNKTIIPFVAHGTGGIASSVRDLKRYLPPSATVLEPIGVYRNDINTSKEEIKAWLENLGFDTTRKENLNMKLSSQGKSINVTLTEKETVTSLCNALPLTLTFSDFNNSEKIAYLPQSVELEYTEEGHQPKSGDLCIYKPWGNLCIFYKDYRYSEDLIYLGHIDEEDLSFVLDLNNSEVTLSF